MVTKRWVLMQLAVAISVLGGAPLIETLPVEAQEIQGNDKSLMMHDLNHQLNGQSSDSAVTAELSPADAEGFLLIELEQSELGQSATTIDEWIAQVEAEQVEIIGVQLEEIEAGLQIVLETAGGELTIPAMQQVGNAVIAVIPNAILALPDGEGFEQFEPAEGIALVSVTNTPDNQMQVVITGTDAPPVAEVTATGLSVTLGEAVVGVDDDAIQVVVTGEQDRDYYVPDASVGTRTDTPLRDIPQSIQVIPQQVIEDQQATRLVEVLQNAPGIVQGGVSPRLFSNVFSIRGFNASNDILNQWLARPYQPECSVWRKH